jgi:FkbM family methyltransferase
MEAHNAGILSTVGKRIAPTLARVANVPHLRSATRLGGIYLDIIQGKGSGSGWDMSGEVTAAVAFLKGVADPVILDVGGNHGHWTLGVWRALGTGRCFLYEPQAACQPDLHALPVPGITIVQSGLSDQPGEMDLHSDSAGSGLASFYVRAESYLPHPILVERVPVTTVDDAMDAHGVDHVDFMKIDVEGDELRVLQGAPRAMQAKAIRSFAFEFGSANIYSRVFFHDFWELASQHGYSMWRILPGGGLLPVLRYTEDLEHFRGVSNYVASVRTPRR